MPSRSTPAQATRTQESGRRRSRTDTITYLRYNSRSHTDGAGGGRYTHRWVVRGHWCRQWYPSLQRHVPIWITDYIAGPDDGPIVVRDKVTMVG